MGFGFWVPRLGLRCGDGRWRGIGCLHSLLFVLGFHSCWLACFLKGLWVCEPGSGLGAWFLVRQALIARFSWLVCQCWSHSRLGVRFVVWETSISLFLWSLGCCPLVWVVVCYFFLSPVFRCSLYTPCVPGAPFLCAFNIFAYLLIKQKICAVPWCIVSLLILSYILAYEKKKEIY